MGRKIFIPITDELLYEHPERITEPLTPYLTGQSCYHWLSVELNPEDNPVQTIVEYRHETRFPRSRELRIPAWLPLQSAGT